MKFSGSVRRHGFGLLVSPFVYVVAWTLPVIGHPALWVVLLIHVVQAYAAFLFVLVCVQMVLMPFRVVHIAAYFVCVFLASFAADFFTTLHFLEGYASLNYAGTQVVEHGYLTTQGYWLKFAEAVYFGFLSCISFVVFRFSKVWRGSEPA